MNIGSKILVVNTSKYKLTMSGIEMLYNTIQNGYQLNIKTIHLTNLYLQVFHFTLFLCRLGTVTKNQIQDHGFKRRNTPAQADQ